ncbi:MAG: Ig-like domain-containing protein [Bacteroidota bacterium]
MPRPYGAEAERRGRDGLDVPVCFTLLLLFLSPALPLFLTACATPIAPRGGTPDRTPPRLEASDPVADTVNVRADRLTLTFSEAVDEGSVVRAFGIVPEWETAPEIIVRGRRVEVRFPDSLRANTTYVVTLDTNLRDLRNVALAQPITLAFATGPELDRGEITGRVLDPRLGTAVAGVDVFAYALADSLAVPDSLPDPRQAAPDYRTQTDEGGQFTLGYLRDAPFFVVAVADAGRNRRADAGEDFAVPYKPVTMVSADSLAAELRLFRTRLDTIPPAPLRVRTRSNRRFAVRFDESVVLRDRDPAAWSLADTTSGRPAAVQSVYADDDPQQLVLLTGPLAATGHRISLARPSAVADSSGNAATAEALTFTPSLEPDTLQTRFLGFLPDADPLAGSGQALGALDTVAVRFNAPPDSATLRRVSVADTLGAAVPFALATRDGLRYRIGADTDQPFRVTVPQPDSAYVRTFVPLPDDERGELSGVVVSGERPIIVEAFSGAARYTAEADQAGTFLLNGLPEGEVQLRVFADRNGNGRWDGGRLAPYAPPEPLRLIPIPQRVRPRWDTVVDTLTLE